MKISKDRLFVAFAAWAGAEVIVSAVNWRFIQLQEWLRSPVDPWPALDFSQIPGLYSALILIACLPLVRRSTIFMVAAFSAFAFLANYLTYFNSLIFKLRCEGPICLDWPMPEFDWADLGYTVLGYALAGVAVAALQWLLDRSGYGKASVFMPVIKWLQIDTEAVSARLKPIKSLLRTSFGGLVVGVCALAAASWLGQVSATVITMPMLQTLMGDGLAYPDPSLLIAMSYVLPTILVVAFTWRSGVIARQMLEAVSWGGLLLATATIHASTIEMAILFWDQANWFQPESASTWGMILFSFALPVAQLLAFKMGNRQKIFDA